MTKKTFTTSEALNYLTPKTQDEHDTQQAHNEQVTLKTQEKQYTQVTQRTRVQKLPRVNMAFSEDNLEHLHIMSRIVGGSITAYVNKLIEADRETQAARVKQFLAVVDKEA